MLLSLTPRLLNSRWGQSTAGVEVERVYDSCIAGVEYFGSMPGFRGIWGRTAFGELIGES